MDPASVLRTVLPNGLTVLFRRDDSAPVAAVVTHVKAGYFDETDDVVGIAHVLEHMFFKGTPSRGVGQIARETKASGGYLNAHTIYDHTAYFAVLPRDGFARGLEVQADAYANSLIDAAELAKELEVIIQEAKRKSDSPGAVTIETLYELLHDRHRIRRWRMGREDGLRALTRGMVVAFYRNFYRPGNTILVVTGDVDEDATLRRIESLYGGLESGSPVRTPGASDVGPPGFRYRELSGDIAHTHMAFGWRSAGSLHADTPSLDLFAMVLGVGRGARLYRGVRERKLASSVSAWNYTPTELGVFGMDAEGPLERAADAARAMWFELDRALREGVTGGEIERAQRMFEARWLRRLETMEGQATFLADWEALGDWRLSETYFAAMMDGRAEQVSAVARRCLALDQASLLLYGPTGGAEFARSAGEAWDRLNAAASPETRDRSPDDGPQTARRLPPAHQPGSPTVEHVTSGVHVYRSRQGVPMLVRRRPGGSMAHFGIYSGVGAAREPESLGGLATLTVRAALKGTERRTAEQIAYEAELLGGTIAPSVTADGFGWTLSVPVTRVADAIELLADVVQSARFPPEAVDVERAVAMTNLAELRDDMYRYPVRLATGAAYPGHPYGRGLLGTEETLQAIQQADVLAFHRSRVLTGPAVIAVVASVDEAELARLLNRAFDGVAPADADPLPIPVWPARFTERVEERARAQTALALAFEAPARHDDRRFAGHLLAGVASGLGGRFFEALREKRSLAYTVQAYAVERVNAGAFLAYIATSPNQEDAARTGLLAEFQRFRDDLVSDEELERAKTYALGSHAIARQSGGNVLWEMIDAWLLGTGLRELDEFPAQVGRVTANELRGFARQYFDPDRRVEGIVRGRPS